jgi:hypothetical protein
MSKFRKKRAPKRVLALPDLEQAKSAVLNTLTSVSGQRRIYYLERRVRGHRRARVPDADVSLMCFP